MPSFSYNIAESSQTGSVTVIIKGIGTGMISTIVPVLTISIAIMLSYLCANGFDLSMSASSLSTGLYGIGIAAVGMLSTLGITLATDVGDTVGDPFKDTSGPSLNILIKLMSMVSIVMAGLTILFS